MATAPASAVSQMAWPGAGAVAASWVDWVKALKPDQEMDKDLP
jgi:hypothetical protein